MLDLLFKLIPPATIIRRLLGKEKAEKVTRAVAYVENCDELLQAVEVGDTATLPLEGDLAVDFKTKGRKKLEVVAVVVRRLK